MYKLKSNILLVCLIFFATVNLFGQQKLKLIDDRYKKSFVNDEINFQFEYNNQANQGETFFLQVEKEICEKTYPEKVEGARKYLDQIKIRLEVDSSKSIFPDQLKNEDLFKLYHIMQRPLKLMVNLNPSIPSGITFCLRVNLMNHFGQILDSRDLEVYKSDPTLR